MTSATVAAPDPSAESERALSDIVLGMRAYHLLSAAVTVALDRRRYRRPRLAAAALALVAGESAWLAWRHRVRHRPLDRTGVLVDTAVGAAAFAVCAAAVLPAEQHTPVNWAFPINLWTAIAASGGLPRSGSAAATGALVGTYVAATAAHSGEVGAEVVSGVLQYTGCWIVGDLVVRAVRRSAVEIARLTEEAVDRAAHIAEESTRAELQRDLHRQSVETLRQVRDLWPSDRAAARAAARVEAARLRRALRGEPEGGFAARLADLVAVAAGRGVIVELVASGLGRDDLDGAARSAVVDVLRAVLDACPSDPDDRAVLRATAGLDGEVEVSLRSRRVPLGDLEPLPGAAEVEALGGTVSLRRPPAGGVRLTVTIPGPRPQAP